MYSRDSNPSTKKKDVRKRVLTLPISANFNPTYRSRCTARMTSLYLFAPEVSIAALCRIVERKRAEEFY